MLRKKNRERESTEDRFENQSFISILTNLVYFLGLCTLSLNIQKYPNISLCLEVTRIFLVKIFHYLRCQISRGGVYIMHMINVFIIHVHLHMYEM